MRNFNKDMPEGTYVLWYLDWLEVVHVPGSERPFKLAEYKKELDHNAGSPFSFALSNILKMVLVDLMIQYFFKTYILDTALKDVSALATWAVYFFSTAVEDTWDSDCEIVISLRRTAECFLCGSPYTCESSFSHMNAIKTHNRTDEHLQHCFCIALTTCTPDFTALAKSRKCHFSHYMANAGKQVKQVMRIDFRTVWCN